MKKIIGVAVLTAGVLCTGSFMGGVSPVMAAEKEQAQAVDAGNKVCPVMGGEASPSIIVEYKGKIYHLCCPGCVSMFNQNPEKYSKIADDEVAVQQAK